MRRFSRRGVAIIYVAIAIATLAVLGSIAMQGPKVYAVVGLTSINMSGNATDSYWSSSGATGGNGGNIASNGDITLAGSSSIKGNAHPGIGHIVNGATRVYGSTSPLTTPLNYPNGDATPYSSFNNDNALIPVGYSAGSLDPGTTICNLPAGHYFLNNLTLKPGGTLNCLGPVTIYCYGTVDIKGQVNTSSSSPKNLSLVMVPNPGTGTAPGNAGIASG